MAKCILWGMGDRYEGLLNQIMFEIHKGNIEIIAIICCEKDRYCSVRDGFAVVSKEDLDGMEYDYIIVTSTFFGEIKQEIMEKGIDESRIIPGEVFQIPKFDFKRYQNLIENPITILSDDCWGGRVYHLLKLRFATPLINILWDKNQYAEFISDPLFYLNTELKMIRDGNLHDGIFPIGSLGDGGRKVEMQFIHDENFEEAKKKWDRRKQRINEQNLFIKMGFSVSEKRTNGLKYFGNYNVRRYYFTMGIRI